MTVATTTASRLEALVRRCTAFHATVVERVLEAQRDPGRAHGVTLFGEGSGITARLPELERRCRARVLNLQPTYGFDPSLQTLELDRRTSRRNVFAQLITAFGQPLSLVASLAPTALVGPVHARGLVVDDRLALLAGPVATSGEGTAWLFTQPDVVAEFTTICEETRSLSVPIVDVPGVVRMTERQVSVTAALCRGEKDATIARRLGISLRSVTSDVSAVIEALGVSSRWEAALLIGTMRTPHSSGPAPAGLVPA